MDKKQLILNILSGVIVAVLSYLILQQDSIFYNSVGEAIGYKRLLILLSLLLFAFIYLLCFYFITKNRIIKSRKANFIIRIFNNLRYPRYIRYNGYIWKINKNKRNDFVVNLFCKIHGVSITPSIVEGDIYHYRCDECNETFSNPEVIENNLEFINKTLKEVGIKHFNERSRRYKKLINSKC